MNKKEDFKYSKQELKVKIRRNFVGYFMLFPWFSLFVIFILLPVVVNILLSMTYFNGVEFPTFIGLNNYFKLFTADGLFYKALGNSFLFSFITGPLSYLLCLFMAWAINDFPAKVRTLLTFVFYLPSLSGNLYLVWQLMFSGDKYGFINAYLLKIGLIASPIQWLDNPKYYLFIVVLVQLWMSLGVGFLAFIAGLQGVDRTYYEAASVDGIKNRFEELWFITLPQLKPILVLGAVLQITASLGSSVVVTSLLGATGGTDYAMYTLQAFMADYSGSRMEVGYVAAVATILSFVMITLNKMIQRGLGKIGN